MLDRFVNIPDMLELDHLTVSGDVTFGKNVTLKVGRLSDTAYMHTYMYLCNFPLMLYTGYGNYHC